MSGPTDQSSVMIMTASNREGGHHFSVCGKLGRSTGSIYHTEETKDEGGKNNNIKSYARCSTCTTRGFGTSNMI